MTDTDLDPTARGLLELYTASRSPSPAALARVRAQVERRIAVGDPGIPPEVGTTAAHVGWWVFVGAAIAIATTLLLNEGFRSGDVSDSEGTPTDTAREPAVNGSVLAPATTPSTGGSPEHDGPSPEKLPTGSTPSPAPLPRLGAVKPTVAPTVRSPKRKKARPAKAPANTPKEHTQDQVKAEMALLGRAQGALQAGDPARALRLLRRHAKDFPKGYLVEERVLQRAVALCKLGRPEDARAAVRKFLRKYPSSPMASHARSICNASSEENQ